MHVTQTSAPCPGCGEALVLLNAPEGRLAGCPACGGTWLDNVVAGWVQSGHVSEVGREFVRLFDAVDAEAARRGVADYRTSSKAERRCPGCREPLEPSRRRELGFTVDVCRTHGAYFDRGELWAAIQSYGVAAGAALASSLEALRVRDEQARSDLAMRLAGALVRGGDEPRWWEG